MTRTQTTPARFLRIVRGHVSPAEYDERAALPFSVGGDDVIAASSGPGRTDDRTAVEPVDGSVGGSPHVAGGSVGVALHAGVGRGPTAHRAGLVAKHALETCRERDVRVERTARSRGAGPD